MNRETRWGSPQRVADGDEKKILMEKLMITETWAGPQDSNSLLIPTDSFDDRNKNFCPLQPGTLN